MRHLSEAELADYSAYLAFVFEGPKSDFDKGQAIVICPTLFSHILRHLEGRYNAAIITVSLKKFDAILDFQDYDKCLQKKRSNKQ